MSRASGLQSYFRAIAAFSRNRKVMWTVSNASLAFSAPMEFFEFLIVFFMAFVLPVTIIKSILDYKSKRLEVERASGEGLRLGELKQILAEVVREANAPLVERVEALEQERLPEYEAEEEDYEDDLFEGRSAERTLGRRLQG